MLFTGCEVSSIGKGGSTSGGAGGAHSTTHDVISAFFRLRGVVKIDIYANAFCSLWIISKQPEC